MGREELQAQGLELHCCTSALLNLEVAYPVICKSICNTSIVKHNLQ